MWFAALAAILAGLLGMDDILARLSAVEGASMAARQRIEELDASTLQLKRAQEASQNAALLARLDPGPLTQLTPYGGASPSVPDLGSPLVARLQADSAMVGVTSGRVDPTGAFGNVLGDPTFETLPRTGHTLTTVYGTNPSDAVPQWPYWGVSYVLNSGVAPATNRFIYKPYRRWHTVASLGSDNVTSSNTGAIKLDWGASAGDITIYLVALDYTQMGTGNQMPSWLAAGVDIKPFGSTPFTNVTAATAYVEIVDAAGTTVYAQSDPEDILSLSDLDLRAHLETAYNGVSLSTPYYWRLRIDVSWPASAGKAWISFTQPQLSWSEDGSLPQFTPAAGAWIPEVTRFRGVRLYRTASQSVADATNVTVLFPSGSATESTDTDGMHDTGSSTGDLVIPWDGYWLFLGSVAFASNATGRRDMWFEEDLDGVVRGPQRQLNLVATQVQMSSQYLAYASAGAVWNLRVFQNSGGALNLIGTDRLTYFAAVFQGV